MVDIHCHILPGLDDGADTMETSIQMAESAIFCGIAAGEAENVVDGTVFLHLRENAAEIIGVEESLSASV